MLRDRKLTLIHNEREKLSLKYPIQHKTKTRRRNPKIDKTKTRRRNPKIDKTKVGE